MKHKIEIAPNLAIYIDGERVIGSKPYGLFLTTVMTVSDDDLKRLADRCLEVILDRKTENSSEKPNNSTKATISKMEQVDKDINVRSKDEPQTLDDIGKQIQDAYDKGFLSDADAVQAWYEAVKDEPQTERSE